MTVALPLVAYMTVVFPLFGIWRLLFPCWLMLWRFLFLMAVYDPQSFPWLPMPFAGYYGDLVPPLDPDPHCIGSSGSGSTWIRFSVGLLNPDQRGSALLWLSWIRIRVDPYWEWGSGSRSKKIVTSKSNFMWRQRLTSIRFRVDPQWFCSLDPDPDWVKKLDLNPHWNQCRSETLFFLVANDNRSSHCHVSYSGDFGTVPHFLLSVVTVYGLESTLPVVTCVIVRAPECRMLIHPWCPLCLDIHMTFLFVLPHLVCFFSCYCLDFFTVYVLGLIHFSGRLLWF